MSATLLPVTLIVLHYHLRPGGVRRVIELATPHLVRHAPRPVTRVVLVVGQRADDKWHEQFEKSLRGVPVTPVLEPAFNYLSEQRGPIERVTMRIRHALDRLFAATATDDCVVWAHNLGVGRNLILSRELAAGCARRSVLLVSHHHDWWFDNRWSRWSEMRRRGFRTLDRAAAAVFPPSSNVLHVAINRADAGMLSKHFGNRALWVPNLAQSTPAPSATRVRAAQRWLRSKLAGGDAPVWLLPCRTLRRKNIAEALLLTRWLRPEAWLVVTGGASSADELSYFRALERAAQRHRWRLHLGVLAGSGSRGPTVSDLFAASEAAVLTSVQEGFGLPYLEAAAARRPLIARRLPNISPDLERFGFRFPQAYDDILIATELFDWSAELARQRRLFQNWIAAMPTSVRPLVSRPQLLASARTRPVAFSRLTLTAQLEVLSQPPHDSWAACASLNPFLEDWRRQAASQKLCATPWPRSANAWLSGEAYARRFHAALPPRKGGSDASSLSRFGDGASLPRFSPVRIQSEFIRQKLDAKNLHPILWSKRT